MATREPVAAFTPLTLVTLVLGDAIGAGVYTTSGFALADLGSPWTVLLAWAVGALVALAGALSYGMLAVTVRGSGGEYNYLSHSLHPAAGLIAGWVSLLAGFTAAAAFAASTFEAYARAALLGLAGVPQHLPAIGLIVAAALVHGARVGGGARVHRIASLSVLAGLVALLAFALVAGARGGWAPVPSLPGSIDPLSFAGSLVWISFSFAGFNAPVYIAGEVSDAARRIPRALVIGTLILGGLYLLLNTVFLFAPAASAISGRPEVAAIAAGSMGGPQGRRAMEVLIALSLITTVSALTVAGPRVFARMAADGALPAKLRAGEHGPRAAIGLQAVGAIVIIPVSGLRHLLEYLGFTLSLCLALTVATLFVTHWRTGRRPASYLYPVAPAMFVAATVLFAGLAAFRAPIQFGAALVTLSGGLIAYAVSFRQRRLTLKGPSMPDRRMLLGGSLAMLAAGGSVARAQSAARVPADDWGEPTYLYPFQDMVARLEAPTRAEWQRPDLLIAKLGALEGRTVYDLGAGTGYLALPFAIAGAAKVIAADPDRRFLAYLLGKRDALGISASRVEARPIPFDNPKMRVGEADWVTCVNTWHQVEHRDRYLAKLRIGLKPGARFMIVNHQKRETPYGPPARLRMSPDQTVAELETAGFAIVEDDRTFSPINYVVVGRRS